MCFKINNPSLYLLLVLNTFILNCKENYESLKFSGNLIEVNKKDFYKIMKNLDYAALYLFYDTPNEETLSEFKSASDELVKKSPAVGTFLFNCKANSLCNDFKFDLNDSIIIIDHEDYEQYHPTTLKSKELISYIDERIRINTIFEVKSLEHVLGYFSNKDIIIINFINEEGELAVKNYFAYEIPYDLKKMLNFYYTHDLEQIKRGIISLNLNLESLESADDLYNAVVVKKDKAYLISSKDIKELFHKMIFLSQEILPYDEGNPFVSWLQRNGPTNHFVCLENVKPSEEDIQSRTNYSQVAKLFKGRSYDKISFFKTKIDIYTHPLCLYYPNFNKTFTGNNFILANDQLTFEVFESFYLNFVTRNDTDLENRRLPAVTLRNEGKFIFSNYFLLFCYDDLYSKGPRLSKWIFVYERLNFLINYQELIIPFYKTQVNTQPSFISRDKIPQGIFMCIRDLEDVTYDIIEYQNGPSLSNLANFLKSYELNFDISEDEYVAYFNEIFYNREYFDTEGQLGDISADSHAKEEL